MVMLARFLIATIALATSSLALSPNTMLSSRDSADVVDIDLLCGTDDLSSPGLSEADETLLAPNSPLAVPQARVIQVYWNVIHANNTYKGGYLSSNQVNAAIAALNLQFTGSGFEFRRAKLKYTKNSEWFHGVDKNDLTTAMKNKLHVGTAKDLNIYTVGFTNSQRGGFATFP
ncbi:unnamed protein product [Rhizoctonia solani]|uniref:Uncharacterized protein n=1 Tax=Rhizoctonia solani TaxID=456999 RepID=A0A8H2ZZD1_9AGAM|nr:unnamed protein product [Rhizoctonia solani]